MILNSDKLHVSNLLHLLYTMGPYIWFYVRRTMRKLAVSYHCIGPAGVCSLSILTYRQSCDVCKLVRETATGSPSHPSHNPLALIKPHFHRYIRNLFQTLGTGEPSYSSAINHFVYWQCPFRPDSSVG